MNTPDPVDSASKPEQECPRARRRFWRLGIWFWLVAWVISICVIQHLVVNLKDQSGVKFFVGIGSVGMQINTYGTVAFNHIRLEEPIFLWSEPVWKYLRRNPQNFLCMMGSVGWRGYAHDHTLAFPIAGFLWVWLIGAWTDGFKNIRLPESFKSKQTMARIAILFAMPLLILVSDHKTRIAAQSTQCELTIRNIQQAVRSHQGMKPLLEGEPMPWDEIFGPKRYLSSAHRKCASGQSYRLKPHVPRMGEVAAQCPDPGHQRRMKQIDTSGW